MNPELLLDAEALLALSQRVGAGLLRRGWQLAVAESCTGGLVGHWLTQVAGSSAYFVGGVIAYSNAVKQRLLGVRGETLARWGAVSPQVAAEMARGARRLLAAQAAVSLTGIAGPGGGTPQKPVGLVYVGLALPGETRVWRAQWPGDRATNKALSVQFALERLAVYLQ